ncbi:SDR family oxidoreductase [Limnobacter humi]|uniref:SDR family oxidoreductase n=1 Tax=Limnobacter humi TaxID=1778671 RepID=A0ABT1WES8_9BURK|nr:SDR family oxidoreductase [Limnobacter humi]MCQ8895388.1 SDR family oxidoreductase [Limnobacter humi]
MQHATPEFALVTGGAKRLGRAIALALAQAGWGIVLHYRSSEAEAMATAQDIRAVGVPCIPVQADLEVTAEVDALFDAAEASGRVRCVVNNASLFEFDSCQQFDPVLFNRHMASNLSAPIQLAKRLHSAVPAGEQGVVVNLLDQKLKNLNPDFFSYTLTKAGLETATTLLAMELAPRVRVVGVAPGLTLISHLQSPEQFEKTHSISPLNKSSEPQDIARTVLFLVQSPAITGSAVWVDGGQHLVPMARDFSLMNP